MVRLGASCDWSRERFTLDPGLSRAVREVFVRLYEKDLIYRGEYMVNWCPACDTAISDLEVAHADVNGHITYHAIGKIPRRGVAVLRVTSHGLEAHGFECAWRQSLSLARRYNISSADAV